MLCTFEQIRFADHWPQKRATSALLYQFDLKNGYQLRLQIDVLIASQGSKCIEEKEGGGGEERKG